MEKVMKFVEKHGLIIILMLMVLGTCTNNFSKRMSEKKLSRQLDSIKTEIKLTRQDILKEIKVEGLKSEKRMIQSTDRKILDVNRQAEIDKELQQLTK
jgi:hypothetical protein